MIYSEPRAPVPHTGFYGFELKDRWAVKLITVHPLTKVKQNAISAYERNPKYAVIKIPIFQSLCKFVVHPTPL